MSTTSADYTLSWSLLEKHMHFYVVSSGKHAVCMTLMKLVLLQGTYKEH